MTGELAIVFLIVGVAVAYLVRLVYQMVAGSAANKCGKGSCGECPSAAPAAGRPAPQTTAR